jgi:hypothetical protein
VTERGWGFAVLASAVPLGLLGDLLLRETPLGLNVVLWTLAFVVSLAVVLRMAASTPRAGSRHSPARVPAYNADGSLLTKCDTGAVTWSATRR